MDKEKAMERLLFELQEGIRSAEKDGWISEEELRQKYQEKREKISIET